MLRFFLALRYLKKKKIVLLSIISVALSTALLVTVASLFTAFIEAVELSASDYMGDIIVEPPAEFSHSDEFISKICNLREISAASAVLSTNGLIHLGPGDVKAVTIWGIDLESRCEVTAMKDTLCRQKNLPAVPTFDFDRPAVTGSQELGQTASDVEARDDAIPVFVGIGLFAEPNARTDEYNLSFVESFIGRDAVITVGAAQRSTQKEDLSAGLISANTTGLQSRSVRVRISDVVYTSVYDIDKRFIFVPIDRLADVLGMQDQKSAEMVHIKCTNGFSPARAVWAVRQIWTDFAAETLNWPPFYIAETKIMTSIAKQSQYTAELRKQMGVLLVIFACLSAGVVVLIFCIFYMIVTSKQKDLAIIKSIGGSSSTIASVFLFFGLFIGILGASIGLAVGFLVTHNVNMLERWIGILFGLKLWSSSIYMFSRIPESFNWYWAWWFFAAAVTASVLGAVLPAVSAARTDPAKILRYE